MQNQVWNINTTLPTRFQVYLLENLFNIERRDILKYGSVGPGARRLVIVDNHPLLVNTFSKSIETYFNHHNINTKFEYVSCGEDSKNLDMTLQIVDAFERFHIARRSEPVIAIGGGVLMDVVGFAASIYRRGIPYIKVPTTLIGIVDASVGAKTGINYKVRRNRLGTYYPPLAAYLDTTFLTTLEKKHISSGLGEILKMAVVKDARLFDILEQYGKDLYDTNFNHMVSSEVIARSITGMVEELEPNLWEKNLKRLVDFGHSFSPLIEMKSIHEGAKCGPPLDHGEAVTLDVLYSCIISNMRNGLSHGDVLRIFKVAKSMHLLTTHPLFTDAHVLTEALNDTKKHRDNSQNLPIPIQIGEATFLNTLSDDEIKIAAEKMRKIQEEL